MHVRALALLILAAALVALVQVIGCLDKHWHGHAAVRPSTFNKEIDVSKAVARSDAGPAHATA